MIIGFVGLGLIGGSLAKSARGFKNAIIYGFDVDEDILKLATGDGAIDSGFSTFENVEKCDLVIFSTPPHITKDLINSLVFKENAVVSDACGVKGFVDEVREDIDFVGGHPMAGKEKSGYLNSDNILFKNANYLLLKRESTSRYACLLMEEFVKYIGCSCIRWTDIKDHDKMIGFTSQLPHVLSAIIVQHDLYQSCQNFEGGSLNDFTRIARLDVNMWRDLFFQNKDNLIDALTFVEDSIAEFKKMLMEDDRESVTNYLAKSRKRRIEHGNS